MNNKTEKYNSDILPGILSEISPAEQEKTDERMLLAARIDDARKASGLTKKQLAQALGKRPSEITMWLSGTCNFTSDTLFDLERVLKTTLIHVKKKNRSISRPVQYIINFHFAFNLSFSKLQL